MKSALTVVLFLLFTIGVSVDGNKESVSLTEGDSVTLKSGVTELKTDDGIEWRFSGTLIAKMSSDSNEIWVESDGSFKDRLQLDRQTGDLKISNIRTTDSGEYKLQISSPRGSSEMIFSVKVVPVDVSADEVESVSGLEGYPVTLNTDLTEIQGDDVIQWRFGQQKSPVAEINRKAGIVNTVDTDERFRDRLKLDQTGSLIIIDTRTTDSGLYQVEISSSRSSYIIHHTQSFRVTVRDSVEPVLVQEGNNVPLRTGLTGTERIEQIRWTFGDDDEIIADLNGPVNKDNFGLNNKTGDLTIRNIQTDQSGLYKMEIKTRTMMFHRKYRITVLDSVEPVLVQEGNNVPLRTGLTGTERIEQIRWTFGDDDEIIADLNGPVNKDNFGLNNQNGELTIRNIQTDQSGDYKVEINTRTMRFHRKYRITVIDSGWSSKAVVVNGVCVGVICVLLGAAAGATGVKYCRRKKSKKVTHMQMNASPIIQPPDNVDLDSNVIYVPDHPPSRNNGEVDKIYDEMTDDTENVSMKNLCGSQSAGSDTENSPFREIKGNKEHGYDIL